MTFGLTFVVIRYTIVGSCDTILKGAFLMPYASHDPLITRQELFSHLGDTHWVVVDCRWSLAHPTLAHQAYQHAHIPGAWFMDMEVDLSGPKGTHGGRHPLPSADHWSSLMQRIGVGTSTNVVAYDEDGVGASRFGG